MNDKEVYLSNLEWTEIHDNMGGVKGNLIFKDNISYEECKKILEEKYFILSNVQLQSNWNSLREWLNDKVLTRAGNSIDLAIENHSYCKVLDKMNELEERIKNE